MGVVGMEEWEAEMRAAVRARSALKFGEDGAYREVAPSAQQRERKKSIMVERREFLEVRSKMATRCSSVTALISVLVISSQVQTLMSAWLHLRVLDI
jgi:hypothetical protein